MNNTIKLLKILKVFVIIAFVACIIEAAGCGISGIALAITIDAIYLLLIPSMAVPIVIAVLLKKLVAIIDASVLEHASIARRVKKLEQPEAK